MQAKKVCSMQVRNAAGKKLVFQISESMGLLLSCERLGKECLQDQCSLVLRCIPGTHPLLGDLAGPNEQQKQKQVDNSKCLAVASTFHSK